MISRIYTLKTDDSEYTFDLADVQLIRYTRYNNVLQISFKSGYHHIEKITVEYVDESNYLNLINELKELYNKSQSNSYEELMKSIGRETIIPYYPFENFDKNA